MAHQAPTADTDRKALAWDGLWRPQTDTLLWRLVHGRPVSQVPGDDLAWIADHMAHDGQQALGLLWDHASWHGSPIVRPWLTAHHQRVTRDGGGRLLVCDLPSQRPGLNPSAPRWGHGTRALLEPTRLLTAQALIERVGNDDGGEHLTPMTPQVR